VIVLVLAAVFDRAPHPDGDDHGIRSLTAA
jgi:hypothetical protein